MCADRDLALKMSKVWDVRNITADSRDMAGLIPTIVTPERLLDLPTSQGPVEWLDGARCEDATL